MASQSVYFEAIVQDVFYGKVMADDRINYFFNGVDMKKQRVHQVYSAVSHGCPDTHLGKSGANTDTCCLHYRYVPCYIERQQAASSVKWTAACTMVTITMQYTVIPTS